MLEALNPDYPELINRYPAQAKELGGKVLGGSYFSGQRGFAFEPSGVLPIWSPVPMLTHP